MKIPPPLAPRLHKVVGTKYIIIYLYPRGEATYFKSFILKCDRVDGPIVCFSCMAAQSSWAASSATRAYYICKKTNMKFFNIL